MGRPPSPPPEVAELAPWENRRGREDRHRNRISSLSTKIEGISDRLSRSPFFAPTHFIYAKLMIRTGTTNAGCCSGGGGGGPGEGDTRVMVQKHESLPR